MSERMRTIAAASTTAELRDHAAVRNAIWF
jgi:hypothetical protein